MSAQGKGDSLSLDKDDNASTTSIQPGIPKNSLEIETGTSEHPKDDGPNSLTFMGEVLEPFDDDVETVIEKKLPAEKEKGLDVDSELDFELKWDDDTDNTNDEQLKSKTDAKIELGLDCDDDFKAGSDLSKTKTDVIDNVSKELLTDSQKTDDKTKIEKQIDVADDISVASVKASEDDAASEENKPVEASDLVSLTASESSSLDERLVYSDVEVPEIEDKELMDELDAQISETDHNLDETALEDDTVIDKTLVEPENCPKKSNDNVSQQTLGSAMYEDEVKLDSQKEDVKLNPNDTLSSSNDLETSSYEIKKDHRLTKPDVMLEIPTQELIEAFDDSDVSDAALEYDEDVLLNNDANDNDPGRIEDKLQIIDDLPHFNKINENNKDTKETVSDDNKIQTDTGIKEQPEITQIKDIEVETNSSDMMEKLLLESSSDNENSVITEEKTSDDNEIELMDVDTENEESHADIILEASHVEPKLIEETEDVSPITDVEPTKMLKTGDTNCSATLSSKLDTEVTEISSSHDIKSIESTETKEETPVVELDTAIKENSTDLKPMVVPEPMEVISTVNAAPKDDIKAVDVTSAPEISTKESTAKEVIPTNDTPIEVFEEIKTTPAEIEPKVTSKVTEVGASNAEPNIESIIASKEITSTTDMPPKVIEEVKSATEMESEVCTEMTEIKEATFKENLENVAVVKEVTSTDVPTKVIEEVESTTEIEPKVVSAEVTKEKEVTSAEESLENVAVVKEVIPTTDVPPKVIEEIKSTSTEIAPEEPTEAKEVVSKDSAQPSTSKYSQESSDEDQEASDSLGLLAESSRVMDDEDEQEHEDDDDDDDFDQDDESNQMTAEHSEDSNAQHSETEVKESMEVEENDKEPLQFQIAEVLSTTDIETLAENEVTENVENEDTEVETAVKSLLDIEEGKAVEETDSTVTEAECATDDTVKLTEEPNKDDEAEGAASKLRELLSKDGEEKKEAGKTSPSKTKKLEITKTKNEINIVELEESSSEDDIQEVSKKTEPEEQPDVTTVNIPDEVEVMSAAAGATSEMRHGEGEVVISGVPKPPPQKLARLNTSEVTIKTKPATTESLVIPETKMSTRASSDKPKIGLEIFNLDSDDDEKEPAPKQLTAVEIDKARAVNRCINARCPGAGSETYPAGAAAVAYYGGRRGAVCRRCDASVTNRGLSLIEGIKDFTPLLSLHMGQVREELVEISDSDSEEETSAAKTTEDAIGEKEAAFLEDQLASMFNNTWKKYSMDARLKAAESEINLEVLKLEEECSKINSMLNECQVATDKLRDDLYDTFSGDRNELPAILIYDTPTNTWSGLEEAINAMTQENKEIRQNKRRSSIPEPPAKRAAIPLGYTPLESDANTTQNEMKSTGSSTDTVNDDDNSDISVVKLSAEAAPADLPQPGTATRPPLRAQMNVYAMRNAFGSWSRARIMDVQPKVNGQFTMCRVKFEHKVKNPTKVLQARCLAYENPSDVRMTIGTRLIALFKDNDNKRESYYSGIVAEIPNPVNNYRYLVFFDDGYAQYVQHSATRLVCEYAPLVWDEVHPFSRQFVREYLCSYPERPMVRVHAGQSIKTEYNGKWWDSKVLQVDASLVQVHFDKENRTEWIYRGSTRLGPLYWELQAAERQRARPLPRAQPGRRFNMPYVEYTRSDEQPQPAAGPTPAQIEQEIRRQRAVAKKSTAVPPPAPTPAVMDGIASRVVFYTPKNAIKPHKMVPHTCGARCRRTDVLALKDLRTYNPLTKPLLSGWERQIVKFKWSRSVMYRAPCGRRLRNYQELHRYLQVTGSDMPVDLFDFGPNTHCLAEFVLTKCRISKKDLSHGKENVPVPCVNYYDDSLPEFCSYNTERTPTAGVPLNLDPEFLCGCDCTDDCADKSKCACWKMTLEGARTIGLDSDEVGYVYKRLPDPLPSGIYECNSRCKCRQTCLNRVAQHPLQLKLQVFKTLNRGWGIRALNDIPKGAFLCVYAGNLLTDATANLDGLNEGDEYLAELDYIEVVEQMKEGFEEDIPDADKTLDKKESGESSSTTSSSEEEEDPRKNADDDDFRPTLPLPHAPTEYSKRLRKRERTKKKEDGKEEKQKDKEPNPEDNCITISDDEELREPARFSAQAGMGDKGFVSKYKSVRAHFGKDEACYIMDAKVQGNIGRYLNHSCTPNVFVQNVFVDTHDPRFPWVAFFALSHIRAGTELTWNYNYDVGSVPGKVLYCHCSAPNCRGRLL